MPEISDPPPIDLSAIPGAVRERVIHAWENRPVDLDTMYAPASFAYAPHVEVDHIVRDEGQSVLIIEAHAPASGDNTDRRHPDYWIWAVDRRAGWHAEPVDLEQHAGDDYVHGNKEAMLADLALIRTSDYQLLPPA